LKEKINHKQKGSNEKKKQLKNKDQIERKKNRGWIILDLKAKLKRKINFTKELKKKPPRE
jgi:hypothetical protein